MHFHGPAAWHSHARYNHTIYKRRQVLCHFCWFLIWECLNVLELFCVTLLFIISFFQTKLRNHVQNHLQMAMTMGRMIGQAAFRIYLIGSRILFSVSPKVSYASASFCTSSEHWRLSGFKLSWQIEFNRLIKSLL